MEQKPIQCPNCKSENVVSTVTYRKAVIIRILKFICIMSFLIVAINNLYELISYSPTTELIKETAKTDQNKDIIISNTFAGISILLQIVQYCIERNACIIHLCKNCNHTWQDTNRPSIENLN